MSGSKSSGPGTPPSPVSPGSEKQNKHLERRLQDIRQGTRLDVAAQIDELAEHFSEKQRRGQDKMKDKLKSLEDDKKSLAQKLEEVG